MDTLITQLERDWHANRRRHTTRRWAAEPLLAEHRTCGELVTHLRTLTTSDADPHLLALARLAGHDDLAARTLLHCMLPGLSRLIATTHHAIPDNHERATTVIGHAWHRIRTYPAARRTSKVAANLLLDTLHDTTGHLRLRRHPELPRSDWNDDDLPLHHSHHPPLDDDLHHTLTDALHHQVITVDEHHLIYATRIHGIGLDQLAAQQHRHPGHLRRRRRHAETALTAA